MIFVSMEGENFKQIWPNTNKSTWVFMSSNETDTSENEDSRKEVITCPSLNSDELIYPTLDMVFHLIASKKNYFSFMLLKNTQM